MGGQPDGGEGGEKTERVKKYVWGRGKRERGRERQKEREERSLVNLVLISSRI